MEGPQASAEADEQEQRAEREDRQDEGAGVSSRLDESADRATRLASRGCAEHAFTGWLSAAGARGRGGQDSAAPAASSASEVALARTLVRDSL
jgi:hypothetical protein